jgi:hypothetical protein
MACTILESNDSPRPLSLSLSLSHGTAEKNRPLHTKHEEKTMHCAEDDGRWHQDKIDPIARAQHHVVDASTLRTSWSCCACDKMTSPDLTISSCSHSQIGKSGALETARSGRFRDMLGEERNEGNKQKCWSSILDKHSLHSRECMHHRVQRVVVIMRRQNCWKSFPKKIPSTLFYIWHKSHFIGIFFLLQPSLGRRHIKKKKKKKKMLLLLACSSSK